MNSKLTENINNQKDSLEQSSIENKVLEGSIDSNYDLNLADGIEAYYSDCLLYTSPSPRDKRQSRMPSSA